MNISLKARVIAAVCGIVAVVMAIDATLHVKAFEREFFDAQRLRTKALVQSMVQDVIRLETRMTIDDMAGLLGRHCYQLGQLNQKDGLASISVIQQSGTLVASSDPAIPFGQVVHSDAVRAALTTPSMVNIDDGEIFHTIVPLRSLGAVSDAVIDVGWLRSGYTKTLHDIWVFAMTMFVLSVLMASGIMSWLLNKVFIQLHTVLHDLRESKIFTQGILDTVPSHIAVLNDKGVIVAVNRSWTQFSIDNSPECSDRPAERTEVGTSYLDICGPSTDKPSADALIASKGIRAVLDYRLPEFQMEYPCHSPTEHRWFMMTVSQLGDQKPGVVVVHTNITERKMAEEHERIRNSILKLIADARPLSFVLENLALSIEALNPGKLCSILLLDDLGKRLGQGVAPSLPDFYNQAVEGLEIGMGVGSCGTAAFTGQRVIVDNIATHPYWMTWRDLAARAGLGSCWSQPIVSVSGKVLGTFAIYHRLPHATTANDLMLLEATSQLVSIAIERSQAAAELRDSLALYRQLTENMKDVVWVLDTHTLRFHYISPSVQALRGFTPEEIMAGSVDESLMPEARDRVHAMIELRCKELASGQISEDTFFTEEILQPHKNGTTVWTEVITHYAHNPGTGHVDVHGVSRNISERKRLQQDLEHQAHIDYLTGVNNRGHFMRLAEIEVARVVRYDGELSNLMMDIDHFKKINDTYGHKSGDLVLKKFAELCLQTLREMDIIGRMGGEEFAVLLPQTRVVRAVEVAERLCNNISNACVPIENGVSIRFTVSIGVTSMRSHSDNLDALLVHADKALYEAKNSGRNKVVLFQ